MNTKHLKPFTDPTNSNFAKSFQVTINGIPHIAATTQQILLAFTSPHTKVRRGNISGQSESYLTQPLKYHAATNTERLRKALPHRPPFAYIFGALFDTRLIRKVLDAVIEGPFTVEWGKYDDTLRRFAGNGWIALIMPMKPNNEANAEQALRRIEDSAWRTDTTLT